MDYERKLFLFLISLIALPSILLSAFAVYSILGQQSLIEQEMAERYSEVARHIKHTIYNKLASEEQNLIAIGTKINQNVLFSFSPVLLFPHIILLDSHCENIRYPQVRPQLNSPPKYTNLLMDYYSKFEQGYIYEYQKKDYDNAISEYQQIVTKKENSTPLGYALFAIARCYTKKKNLKQAWDTYKYIVSLFSDETLLKSVAQARYFVVEAHYQRAMLAKYQNNLVEEGQILLSLLKYLIHNEYRLSQREYWHYYKKILKRFKTLPNELSWLEKEKFNNKKRKIFKFYEKMQKEELELKIVGEHIIDSIKKIIATNKNKGYFTYKATNQERIGYFCKIPKEDIIVVGLLDMQQCLEKIVMPVIDDGQGKDHFVALINREEERLAGISSGDIVATEKMEVKLSPWQIAIYLKNKNSLEELARSRSFLNFGGIIVIILVLFVGVYGSIATFIREVKNAHLKSDFVSNVTHELKTPLTAIKMFVETLLMERTHSREEQKECLEVIESETERLSRLIDRILDFAKMEKNKRTFHFVPDNIGTIIEETIVLFKKQVSDAGCTFSIKIEKNLPRIYFDKEAIGEVLANLLSNSYKYTEDTKKIEVFCSKSRENIAISIKDNGMGIPRHEFQRIFQKFYRIEDSLTRQIKGTGLGLSIVQTIVKAHYGKIKVHSKVGLGSKFTVLLPIEFPGETPIED